MVEKQASVFWLLSKNKSIWQDESNEKRKRKKESPMVLWLEWKHDRLVHRKLQHAAILPQENEEVKISGRIQGRHLVTGVEIAWSYPLMS